MITPPDFGCASINKLVECFQAKNGRDPSGEELQLMAHLRTVYLLEVLSDKMIEAVTLLEKIADRSL